MWPAIGAIGGAIIGGVGAERANRVNQREAERNRQFQERMRNTEWQAAMADMQAAGVNPALALQHGGASSPGGSMPAGAENVSSSALQGARVGRELELLKASISKERSLARSAEANANVDEARSRYLTQGRRGEVGAEGPPLLREQVESDVRAAIANAARAGSMAEISGLGGQVAQGFQDFMPAFRNLTRVAGQGAGQVAGVVDMLERASRMRDDAVRTWLGLPKAAALRLLKELKARGGG